MSTSSDVWFLFASFPSLPRFSWSLIGHIHMWERTVIIRLKTSIRKPHCVDTPRLQLNYGTHKNILTAQVCEHPTASSRVHSGRDQHAHHPILPHCSLLPCILQQLLQVA